MKKTLLIIALILITFCSLFAFTIPASFISFLKMIGFQNIEDIRKFSASRNQEDRKILKLKYEQLQKDRWALLESIRQSEDAYREKSKALDAEIRMMVEGILANPASDAQNTLEAFNNIEKLQTELLTGHRQNRQGLRDRNIDLRQQMAVVVGDLASKTDLNPQTIRSQIEGLDDQQKGLLAHLDFAEEKFRDHNESVQGEIRKLFQNLVASNPKDDQALKQFDMLLSQKEKFFEDRQEAERRINDSAGLINEQMMALVDGLASSTPMALERSMEKSRERIEANKDRASQIDSQSIRQKQKDIAASLKYENEKLKDDRRNETNRQKAANEILKSHFP